MLNDERANIFGLSNVKTQTCPKASTKKIPQKMPKRLSSWKADAMLVGPYLAELMLQVVRKMGEIDVKNKIHLKKWQPTSVGQLQTAVKLSTHF